jgi:hypothetical protein
MPESPQTPPEGTPPTEGTAHDPEAVTALLRANGFIAIRREALAAYQQLATLPLEALQAVRHYLIERRNASELKTAANGAQVGDGMDADLLRIDKLIAWRGDVDQVEQRIQSRQELRAGTQPIPKGRRPR